jgi:menaquinone-specific isochorismate synthase
MNQRYLTSKQESIPKVIASHNGEISFFSPDNHGENTITCFDRKNQILFSNNYSKGPLTHFEKGPHSIVFQKFHSTRFEKDFATVKRLISESSLKKAVVFNTLEIEMKENLSIGSFNFPNNFLRHNLFCHFSENRGVIGLSPEVLFEGTRENLLFHALAGTIKKASEIDEKLENEHQLVVDDICNKLQGVSQNLEVQERKLLGFKDFFHLYTPIIGRVEAIDFDLVRILSPTAALGGYPQSSYFDYLQESIFEQNKNFDPYGGVFLFNSGDFFRATVMIRSISWCENKLYVHAGCGVVEESTLEQELNESKMKIQAVLDIFGIR